MDFVTYRPCDICTKMATCLYKDIPGFNVQKCEEYDEIPLNAKETPSKPKDDLVNHPSHYTQGGVECIEAIRSALGEDGFQASCVANVIKYVWRYKKKNGLQDLAKAQVYLSWLIESVEKETNSSGKPETSRSDGP